MARLFGQVAFLFCLIGIFLTVTNCSYQGSFSNTGEIIGYVDENGNDDSLPPVVVAPSEDPLPSDPPAPDSPPAAEPPAPAPPPTTASTTREVEFLMADEDLFDDDDFKDGIVPSIPGARGSCTEPLGQDKFSASMPMFVLGKDNDGSLFNTKQGAFNHLHGGRPGFFGCAQNENVLDGISGRRVTASEVRALEGKRVCLVVFDSDISDDPENEKLNLKGARKGVTAFDVLKVFNYEDAQGLPTMKINILETDEIATTCLH